MTHDPRDWEGIKQAYVHGDWSLQRIAEALGTSEYMIRTRAKKDGWTRRVGTKPLPRAFSSGRFPGSVPRFTSVHRALTRALED